MSENYHVTLNFSTRRDMPDTVKAALTALSEGRTLDSTALASLPELIRYYLSQPPGIVGEGGAAWRLQSNGFDPREQKPQDLTHVLHMECMFHDDEYANAAAFFVEWLFQFAGDGHLGLDQLWGEPLPFLYTRQGDEILTTTLDFEPAERATPASQSLRPETSTIVSKTSRSSLARMVARAENWTLESIYD